MSNRFWNTKSQFAWAMREAFLGLDVKPLSVKFLRKERKKRLALSLVFFFAFTFQLAIACDLPSSKSGLVWLIIAGSVQSSLYCIADAMRAYSAHKQIPQTLIKEVHNI